jgi:hypothetical protein
MVIHGTHNLNDADHLQHLLTWLNAWGCRQFSREYHEMASNALREWGREHLARLPGVDSSLLTITDHDLEQIVPVYDRLSAIQAAVRQKRSTGQVVTVGPTGAAKILHALRPGVFLPWDQPIRSAFRLDGSGVSYQKYLVRAQAMIRLLIEDAGHHGIAAPEIAKAIGRPGSSLPKLLDEFYWVTITRKVKLPTPDQLATWCRWAEVADPEHSARPRI